jgi:hypothetical protein
MKTTAQPIPRTERQKAHAIARALSGGSKARATRMEISILAVLATFGGSISHTEKAAPVTYPLSDYTQDPEAEPLSAQ